MVFILILITLAKVGVISETDDAWSNRIEKAIRQSLYKMKRFRLIRRENTEAIRDSSKDFILKSLDLDYLVVGNLERLESDIEIYTDVTDTVHGGYRKVAVAEIAYEVRIYQKGKRPPSWQRFVTTGEVEWGKVADAEEIAFKSLRFKVGNYLREFFVLQGKIVQKIGREVWIDLGKDDGIRPGMTFLARGREGVGYFKIREVDDTSKGIIFKGVKRIRKGNPIRECPHGVSFLHLGIGYTQFRTEVEDQYFHPYGIHAGIWAGRKLQFGLEGGFGFGEIFSPMIGLDFGPLFYLGEDLAMGPLCTGKIVFAFQKWESTDGGEVLGDTTGIAVGHGLIGLIGGQIRYDFSSYHLKLRIGYPFATRITEWTYSRVISGTNEREEVPPEYLTHRDLSFKDFIIKFGFGYNFEAY
ncbi:hypothetical protein DRP53_01850 [candidate division WOR-3 bacterium]|uniref:Uncharacterized protein n=1 Tax=candidate division WOR-3 bacterium TaxID=2052148 RepID=A0A660SKN6_UNCW3|nr:MAG: hypothetical protein DRP53_01850 [candidate division WOR-3 bacterium]